MKASAPTSEPLRASASTPAATSRLAWATWPAALALLAGVLLVRLAYMIWLSPVELAGDEAYYWEQARHLDWCYNEKGPALPWMIAACCRMFGDTEWAVRLPMLVSFGLAAWGVGRLAVNVSRGDERAGFFAILFFILVPAFQANALICTQDGPVTALWVALTAISLRLVRRWREGRSTWAEWLLLWGTLGVGALFKQSIVLFLPGLAIYWWIQRRTLRLSPTLFIQQMAGVLLFGLLISPMVWWNARHGWPMLSHTLGHVASSGDQAGQVHKGNPATWFLSIVGGVVGAVGPAAVLLMVWSGRRAARERAGDEARWRDRLLIMCAAWPPILFFVALSFTKPVIASWPLPSFAPLAALVGEFAAVGASLAAVVWGRTWGVFVVYGLAAWLLMSFPTPLGHLPIVGEKLQKSLLKRITGHREAAADLQQVLATLATPDGRPPQVVTRHYMQAVLYSFYLPDHPRISTAGKYLGKRSTTLDQWSDTRLDNPQLFGRSLLLVELQGNVPRDRARILAKVTVPWDRALLFDDPKPVDGGRFTLVTNYRGPRSDDQHPAGAGEED